VTTPPLTSHPPARFLLMGASVIVILAGLKAAETLLIPFFLAAFLAILCAPIVAWLTARRVPTVVAVLLVVLILGAISTAVGAIVGGSVNNFVDALPRYQERLNHLGTRFDEVIAQLPVVLPEGSDTGEWLQAGRLLAFLGTGLKGLIGALQNTFLVILTLVFMLLEATSFPIKLRLAFGERTGSVERFSAVAVQVQRYLAIKTIMSLATGLFAGSWVAFVGLDFAVVWGLLAFLLNYIPTIGSVVAAIPAVLLALVQLGFWPAVLVGIGFLAVNVTFGNLVEPALMGRTLGLSTLVVFLSLVFWGWMWGTVGMLLSVPLTMMIKIFLENSEDLKWVAVLLDSGRAAERRRRRRAKAAEVASSDEPAAPV
jgi:AI-2 transport protein TqsA